MSLARGEHALEAELLCHTLILLEAHVECANMQWSLRDNVDEVHHANDKVKDEL